jgi:hypothetical protein
MSKSEKIAWVFRFLKWFCPDHLYEEIEGCDQANSSILQSYVVLSVVLLFSDHDCSIINSLLEVINGQP